MAERGSSCYPSGSWEGFSGSVSQDVSRTISRYSPFHRRNALISFYISASNKRVKPVDVRRIEHEDFIDYEIEFVELNNDEADTEEFIFDIEDFSNNSRDKVQNDNEDSESEEVNLVSFVDVNTVRSKQRARGGVKLCHSFVYQHIIA